MPNKEKCRYLKIRIFSLLDEKSNQEIEIEKESRLAVLTYIIRIVILCRFSESVDANEASEFKWMVDCLLCSLAL